MLLTPSFCIIIVYRNIAIGRKLVIVRCFFSFEYGKYFEPSDPSKLENTIVDTNSTFTVFFHMNMIRSVANAIKFGCCIFTESSNANTGLP